MMKKVLIQTLRFLLKISPDWILLTVPPKFPILLKYLPLNRELISPYYLGNVKVNINTRYRIERKFLLRIYEEDSTYIFNKTIKPGDVCIDIGANVGALSLLMAKLVGPKGEVYSFEPGPVNFLRLKSNFHLNPSLNKRVRLIQSGISDKLGFLYWSEENHNPGNARLIDKGDIQVKVTTIDNYFSEVKLEKLNFVKIDVETMEWEVLKGGINTWKKYKPIIYFETQEEFRFRNTPEGIIDLYEKIEMLLTSIGYSLYKLNERFEIEKTDSKALNGNTIAILGTDNII